MKLSQTTLLAILATTSLAAAAPTVVTDNALVVKRADANEVLDILEELKSLHQKRDLAEGDEAFELSKRADDVIGNFVSALANSGLLGQVWDDLANNTEVRSEVVETVEAAVRGAIVRGPALIRAIWNSGLLRDVFQGFLNDRDLRSSFFALARSIFSSALNLLRFWRNGRNGGSSDVNTATSISIPDITSSISIPDVTSSISIPEVTGSLAPIETRDVDILDKRDIASVVSTVVQEILNSGILRNLVNRVLADPERSISFLTTLFRRGVVVAEDILNWARQSGLLQEGLQYLEQNGGTFGSLIADILGPEIQSGNVSASDIDGASSGSTGTAVTTTAVTLPTAVQDTTVVTDVGTTLVRVRRAFH